MRAQFKEWDQFCEFITAIEYMYVKYEDKTTLRSEDEASSIN